MSIWDYFTSKPERRKTRRRKTKAEKRKELAEERLMARAQTDPKAESALILKETGVDIPPIDETKQEEKKVDEKLTRMALEKIDSDENLKERATAMKIERILGGDSQGGYGEEGQYYPLEGDRGPLDIIAQYRELEREFGSGTGALSFLKDPQVIAQAFAMVRSLLPGIAGATAAGVGEGEDRPILVEVNGELIEMSPQDYQLYKTKREQLRLAQPKQEQLTASGTSEAETEGQPAGKTEKTAASPIVEEDPKEEVITPYVADRKSDGGQETTQGINIGEYLSFAEEIASALEGTPQQFAEDLAASAKEGNRDSHMLLLSLSTITYDQLVELVKPYEQTEGLVHYIKKLLDSKEWVEEALASIRGLVL